MDTPICDFVNSYTHKKAVRLHMPGHKGKLNSFDITEIPGADVLYDSEGIIMKSEKNASCIFGTYKTCFSTEGSSLCIRAMLYLAKIYSLEKGKAPVIASTRNAHKTFVTCAGILNLDVRWFFGKSESMLSCDIDLCELEAFFKEVHPTAFFVTSPDYVGKISDIKGISSLCKKYDVLFMVDNAHGAYLKFLDESMHPIDLGTDLCCDSAHKTLNALTGGAYLHISENAPQIIKANAQKALSLFASTSPSYLILESLDLLNKELSVDLPAKLKKVISLVNELKEVLLLSGYTLYGNEPAKLTIIPKSLGYLGTQLSKILEENNIFVEFSDTDFVVMMFSSENTEEEINYVKKVLTGIKVLPPIKKAPPSLHKPKRVLSISEALNMPSEKVSVTKATGRILASPSVSCPPAVSLIMCGEEIDKNTVDCFNYYSIEYVDVIKQM